MIVWFTPSRIEGRASGSCTFSRSCRGVRSVRLRRLDDLLRHLPDPEVGEPDRRRQRVDHRRDHAGDPPELEQEDHRHQVDERRHRLHRVEHRLERPAGTRRSSPTRRRAGSRSTIDRTTATSTWLSVSIAQVPHAAGRRSPGRSRRRTPPGSRGGTASTRAARCPPTIIHHGSPISRFLSGSSANLISQSLIAFVTPENVLWIQSSALFAGVGDRDGQALGPDLLPQHLAADEHRRPP